MKKNKLLNLLLSLLVSLNTISCGNKENTSINDTDDNTNDVDNNFNDKENNSSEEEIEEKEPEQEEIEPTSYDYEEVIKTPTCTEPGEKLVRYGEKEKTITLAPLGHNFSSGHVIKNPTETEKGIKEYKCSNPNCNEVITEEFELKDSFKTFTEKIITAPTCTEDGLKEYKLLNNGVEEVIQEVLPSLGHNFIEDKLVSGALISKPSNTDGGMCKKSCSRCKELSDDTFATSSKDFFYTEGLKKLSNYDMKVYPYLQKMWRDIESGLDSTVKQLIAEKDHYTFIKFKITRDYNEIPNKPIYDGVEHKIAHMVRHVNPQYWYLTCSRASETNGMSDFTIVNKSGSMVDNKQTFEIKYRKIDNVYLDSKNDTIKNVDKDVSSLISPGMNDLEKLCAICKFVCSSFSYVVWGGNLGDFVSFYEKGYGVCANFAAMFNYMAQKAGLCCVTKTTSASQSESNEVYNHAWNWVLIDGNFYNVDTTHMKERNEIFSHKFLYNIDSASLSTSFFNSFVEPKYINKFVGSNIIQLYKNGKTNGMYTSIDKALEKVNDSNASYKIDCNLGFNRNITNQNCFTYQTKINCKELHFYTSRYSAEIQAPKEFFDNNNITVQDNITVKYI